MYGWIWDRFPGPMPVRIGIALVLVFALITLLFLVVFPYVDEVLLIDDPNIGAANVWGGDLL